MKKKFALFGNCQTHAMKYLLQQSAEFRDSYKEIQVVESFNMTSQMAENFCREIIPQVDLVIAQPHSERLSKWHRHSQIQASCEELNVVAVFTPQIFFSAYNPWERNIHGIDELCKDDRIIYTDCFIASHVVRGSGVYEFLEDIEKLTDNRQRYMEQELQTCIDYQLNIENSRMCDIKLLDYIMDNWQSERLLQNNNHPKGKLMKKVADKILKMISIDFSTDKVEMFQNHASLIYPFVARHSNLEFQSSEEEIKERFYFYREFFGKLNPEGRLKLLGMIDKYLWNG